MLAALLATAARGRLIREGLHVAIAGRPNAGKSSLFNQLAGAGRAIVTDLPGHHARPADRDVDVDGVPMTLVDTAGVRSDAGDAVEAEGIARAVAARETAAVIVLVLDRSPPLTPDDRALLDGDRGRAAHRRREQGRPAGGVGRRRPSACARDRRSRRGPAQGIEELRSALLRRNAAATSRRAMRRRSRTCGTPICWSARARRSSARAARPRRGTPEEFVLPTCTRRGAGSKRSPARARRTTCCTRSSPGSALESNFRYKCHRSEFDVVVIGAGHAGVEAAWAAARMGRTRRRSARCRTATVAHMPCNPAIGGTAKGHLVREIDALGGLMGRAIDATGIQFKLLNRSRGPAVWSPRAQADKRRYSDWVARGARARAAASTGSSARPSASCSTAGGSPGLALEDGTSICAAGR